MSVENEKEIQQLKNRIRELADKSYNQNQYTFTGFLGLAEQDALWQVEREVKFAGITLYGGREEAERKILRFGSEAELGYEQPFPICCIRIRPLSAKFADKLSHRDYLGALMNLGIDRCKIGDIIAEDHKALIFVKEEMAEYVTDNLTQIRHTHVKATIGTGFQVDYEPRYEELKGTVSSIRLDSVLALAYPLSRSKITSQIEAGKVFVNGKLITSNGYRLKENDIISVRKMGRIAYNGILSETKKGRYMISVRKDI